MIDDISELFVCDDFSAQNVASSDCFLLNHFCLVFFVSFSIVPYTKYPGCLCRWKYWDVVLLDLDI